MDAIVEFKNKQRESWSHFTPLEMVTTPSAARLVRFANVRAGQTILDVGCGTGVAALTARRTGAKVTGVDLTPELLARAKEHTGVEGFEDVTWKEGDAEALPFADAQFDVVLSQFGHMFAPRADVTTREMLRVLKPGGTIAFSTWPPDQLIGKLFAYVGKHTGPLPTGASPSPQWGDVEIVRARLGNTVRDIVFDRETLLFPAVSPAHYRVLVEKTSGPIIKLIEAWQSDRAKIAQFRRDLEAIVQPYFDPERNLVRASYLMTRATKT